MDSKSYLTLNSWLQKADHNYYEGRLLWLHMCLDGACNLLWLSCEQMIKILLLQKKIDEISSKSKNLNELHKKLDRLGKSINHDAKKLIKELENEYPDLDINKFIPVLEKLQEYFFRRYVVHQGSSISLMMIKEIDEFYFLLRNKVEANVGLGTIDEIYIQKKHKWKHPLEAFAYAYIDNKSFRSRKHRVINIQGPDRKIYKEDGT